MNKQYKRVLIVCVLVLTLLTQTMTAFAATASVKDYTEDTDFWWDGWEHYTDQTFYKTISYNSSYSLKNTTTSYNEWWQDNVLFRCTTTTYNYTIN